MTRTHLKKPYTVWYSSNMEVHLYVAHLSEIPSIENPYIYLTNRHLKTQTINETYSFLLFRAKKENPIAVFHLTPSSSTTWNSPAKAPFGGIQSHENCEHHEVIFLLKCVEKLIKMGGGKKIIIKTHPENYDITQHKKLYTCYKRSGYRPKEISKNHLITVTDLPFSSIIKSSENRRLKKRRKAEFTVMMLKNPDLIVVYDFIKTIRDHLGYDLSLTFHELKNLIEIFPNEIKIFSVNDQDRLIALTVTVLVNHETLYNFLPADLPEYRQYSPMVHLMDGIYRYCQQEKIRTIDLGTSLDHLGHEKASLVRFKENIGGKECRKITWQKDLDTQTVIGAIEDGGTGFMPNDG